MTGGASGIGVETARALAGAGAEVTLAVRDEAAGGRACRHHGRAADADAGGLGDAVLMPGGIRTNLQRYVSDEELERLRNRDGVRLPWKTTAQGAATSVFVASSPLLDGVGGRYFEDCNEAGEATDARHGVAPYALDPKAAHRLWQVSVATLTGRLAATAS